MILFLLFILSVIHRAQLHLTYQWPFIGGVPYYPQPINYCYMASTCIHDNQVVCASTPEGCSRRNFLDQCDMYEYNCDFGTRYQETYKLLCSVASEDISNNDIQLSHKAIWTSTESTTQTQTTTTQETTQIKEHHFMFEKVKHTTEIQKPKETSNNNDVTICCDRPKTWETTTESVEVLSYYSSEEISNIIVQPITSTTTQTTTTKPSTTQTMITKPTTKLKTTTTKQTTKEISTEPITKVLTTKLTNTKTTTEPTTTEITTVLTTTKPTTETTTKLTTKRVSLKPSRIATSTTTTTTQSKTRKPTTLLTTESITTKLTTATEVPELSTLVSTNSTQSQNTSKCVTESCSPKEIIEEKCCERPLTWETTLEDKILYILDDSSTSTAAATAPTPRIITTTTSKSTVTSTTADTTVDLSNSSEDLPIKLHAEVVELFGTETPKTTVTEKPTRKQTFYHNSRITNIISKLIKTTTTTTTSSSRTTPTTTETSRVTTTTSTSTRRSRPTTTPTERRRSTPSSTKTTSRLTTRRSTTEKPKISSRISLALTVRDKTPSTAYSWWYPTFCHSGNCEIPVTWETTKNRRRPHRGYM